MYKPIFKRPEDELSHKVEEKVKLDLDSRIKNEVDKRVQDILKEREEKEKTDKATKLAKAVDMAKTLKGEGEDKDKDKFEKEKIEKERKEIEKDMLCPTCHTEGRSGHIHKVDTDKSGLVYRCHDGNCGFEAILVPKNSDYKCKGCGMAIKKPEKEEHAKEMEGCPFCKSTKAIKFDWGKVWDITKK